MTEVLLYRVLHVKRQQGRPALQGKQQAATEAAASRSCTGAEHGAVCEDVSCRQGCSKQITCWCRMWFCV